MIRGLKIVVLGLALANVLAAAGFLGWLKASGRLDAERFQRVRTILAETVASEKAREAAAQAEAESARKAEEEIKQQSLPPLTAAEQLAVGKEGEDMRRQIVERLRREAEDLRRTLQREREEVEQAAAKLKKEREEFEAMRKRIAAMEGNTQFEKALKMYESLKPAQAKAVFEHLISQGEIEQVVAYLNAMQERQASKVLAEFKDPTVASDLLERLRTRGLVARSPEAKK